MKNNLHYNANTQANDPRFPQEPLRSPIDGSNLGLKIGCPTSATNVVLKRLRYYASTENTEMPQPLPDQLPHPFGKERRKEDVPSKKENHAKTKGVLEYARRMLVDGTMPLEMVSRLAGVNLATVKELAAQMTEMANPKRTFRLCFAKLYGYGYHNTLLTS